MAAWKAPTIKSKIFLSTEDCVFLSSREYYRGVQRVVGNLIDRVKGLRTRDCLFIENQIMSELPYTDKMHPLRFAFQLLLAEKHFAKHFEQPEKELACKARMQRFFKQHSHFQSKFPGQSPTAACTQLLCDDCALQAGSAVCSSSEPSRTQTRRPWRSSLRG
jgi:hypothetical protein